MKKIIFLILCLVALISLILISCNPNESTLGEKPAAIKGASVNVKMKATSGVASARMSSGRTMADSIVISQASLGVSWLVFEMPDSTGNASDSTAMDSLDVDEGFKVDGPFTFDLIAGMSTPTFAVTPGQYDGIAIKLAPVLPDGKSIFIAFDATGAADTAKVEFSSSNKRAFGIKGDSTGFQFDGTDSQVLVLLHLDALFADIDFSKATVGADGVIRISEKSNTRLYNKIMSNLGTAFKADEE